MKRNNLTTALIAGIAGVAGIASVSTAVNLNSDGVGQVLLFPYYTVNGGNNTLISVVNTTGNVKAVKVRFLEGKNSRECLDFNLYLSPYDVWTAALVAASSTVPNHGGESSGKIITNDASCLSPNDIMTGSRNEFLPYGYDPQDTGSGAAYDTLGTDLERCTEGHFEMIEMGNVENIAANNNAAAAVTHGASGVPADCSVVHNNFLDGTWNPDATIGIEDTVYGSGGLFASASIVNVANGTNVSYNADAIQAYSSVRQHTAPGSLIPNVATGDGLTSNIFNNGTVVTDLWNINSVQAISAIYMHDHIYGEYEISDDIGAQTEWVVTFPTKTYYVDPFISTGVFAGVPKEPFTVALDFAGNPSCEPFTMQRWDREEQQIGGGDLLPSPLPPGILGPVFCWEANVLEFFDGNDVFGPSHVLGSNNNLFVVPGFDNGWAEIAFAQNTNDNVAARTYTGLPVTGFAVQKYVNGTLGGGSTLANYAGLFAHRYSKNIQ